MQRRRPLGARTGQALRGSRSTWQCGAQGGSQDFITLGFILHQPAVHPLSASQHLKCVAWKCKLPDVVSQVSAVIHHAVCAKHSPSCKCNYLQSVCMSLWSWSCYSHWSETTEWANKTVTDGGFRVFSNYFCAFFSLHPVFITCINACWSNITQGCIYCCNTETEM